MKLRLSKVVGRSQMPGDEVAIQRVSQAFVNAAKPLPKSQSARPTQTKTVQSAAQSRKVPA